MGFALRVGRSSGRAFPVVSGINPRLRLESPQPNPAWASCTASGCPIAGHFIRPSELPRDPAFPSSGSLLPTKKPTFSRRLRLLIPLGVYRLLTPVEHVLRRNVADGTVQADIFVMLDVAIQFGSNDAQLSWRSNLRTKCEPLSASSVCRKMISDESMYLNVNGLLGRS